jgi:hypothetical protein
MADFALYESDGSTPASLNFGRLFEGFSTSWRDLVLKNISNKTITETTLEGSSYEIRFLDADGNPSAGLDGFIATQSGQTPGTILSNGMVAFQVSVMTVQGGAGDKEFTLDLAGVKDGDDVTDSFAGSYSVVAIPAQELVWKVSVVQPSYPRLHFDEDGTLNAEGLYMEDPENPGTLILDPQDGSGNYPDLAGLMETAGVRFVNVLPSE